MKQQMTTVLWIFLLLMFVFASFLIDRDVLPRHVFRHVWNVAILCYGAYLLVRMRIKIMQGAFEKLQREHQELSARIEKKRHDSLRSRIEDLSKRLQVLEEGK